MTSHKIIKASAGSGKTFRLSLRFIALISTNPDPNAPAQILATTFSRKAAAEILERVLLRLSSACLDPEQAHDLSNDLKQHEQVTIKDFGPVLLRVAAVLHRLQVATLDGYFARIASCFRAELDLPPAAGVMEEENAVVAPMRLQAITDVLESIQIEDILGLLQRIHHDDLKQSVLGSLQELVGEVYALYKAEPHKHLWTTLQTTASRRTDAQITKLTDNLKARAEAESNTRFTNAILDIIDAIDSNQWEKLGETTIIVSVMEGRNDFNKKPLPDDILPTLNEIIDEACKRATCKLAEQTLATFNWARLYADTFDKLRKDRGLVFFSDIPQALRNRLITSDEEAINLSEEIYYRLDARTQHLLLDEFQDTSLDQWRVLKPTAQEIISQGGAADGQPSTDRSLLIVGDVKQAIYGWRGGCAEIFATVQQNLQLDDNVIEPLTESYRSSQVVLDVVNTVFANLTDNTALAEFKDDEASDTVGLAVKQWQSGFDPHKAHKNLPGYVTLEVMPRAHLAQAESADQAPPDGPEHDSTGDAQADSGGKTSAAAQAATAIAQIHREHPERTIGVLVSSNNFGFQILGALRRLGIEASGETGVRIADDPAVACVLAGLKLADHPGDTIAAFHVFNSPLANAVGLGSIKPFDLGMFAWQTREHIAQEGMAGLLARWTRALAASCSAENLRRLWQLVQFAQEQESLGFGRITAFVQSVTQAQVQEPTPAKVRVMTIYKSKGLEFDIVVMPQLEKALARVEKKCFVLRESKAAPVQAVFRSANRGTRRLLPEEVTRAYLGELYARLTDDLCALYVGMTRARYALHLLAPIAKTTSKGKARKPPACYLTVLEAALKIDHQQTTEPGKTLYHHGVKDWDTKSANSPIAPPPVSENAATPTGPQTLPALKAFSTTGRSLPSVSPSSLEDGASVQVADLLALEKPTNRRRGTLFHRWFEQVEYLSAGKTALTVDDLKACSTDLTAAVPEQELAQWMSLFLTSLSNPVVMGALSQPEHDKSLGNSQRIDLWREHDFVVYDDGKLLRGQFDRVLIFRDATGRAQKAELLDFKTDRVTQESVKQVVEGYTPQIKAYMRGLSRLLDLDDSMISGRLLFVGGEPRVEDVSG